MTLTLKILFWLCAGAIVYNYAGYPVLLFLIAALSQAKSDLRFFITRTSRRVRQKCQRGRVACPR